MPQHTFNNFMQKGVYVRGASFSLLAQSTCVSAGHYSACFFVYILAKGANTKILLLSNKDIYSW